MWQLYVFVSLIVFGIAILVVWNFRHSRDDSSIEETIKETTEETIKETIDETTDGKPNQTTHKVWLHQGKRIDILLCGLLACIIGLMFSRAEGMGTTGWILCAGWVVVGTAFIAGLTYLLGHRRLFIMFPDQGKIYPVIRSGEEEKMIMSFKGFHLNNPRDTRQFDFDKLPWEVLPDEWERTTSTRRKVKTRWVDTRPSLFRWFGIYGLGYLPNITVYRYPLIWKEWKEQEDGTRKMVVRPDGSDFVFAKIFAYASILEEAEYIGRGRVNVKMTIHVKTINGRTAIFKTDEWFLRLESYVLDSMRRFVKAQTYDELVARAKPKEVAPSVPPTQTTDSSEDPITELISELNHNIPGLRPRSEGGEGTKIGLVYLLGLEIIALKIDQIELSADQMELDAALTAQSIATERGKAALITKEFDAKGIREVYKAVSDYGNLGAIVRSLEALERSGEKGNTVIWANNPLGAILKGPDGGEGGILEALRKTGMAPDDIAEVLKRIENANKNKP